MNKNTLKMIVMWGLFLVPFIPFLVSGSFFFPFITSKAFAFRVIVEVIFAAWALLAFMSPEYHLKKSPILYALLAFLVVIGLADVFGALPLKSFWSNYERMEGYVALLHFGAFFVVIGSVFKEVDWKRWWNTSLVASFMMVLYACAQLLGVTAIHQGGVRVDGTIGNATYLAVYMLIHIFIALLFLYRERRNTGMKWLYGALILLQAFILYETATRGAILGFIGGLILLALLNIRNKENPWMKRVSLITISSIIVVVAGVALLRNTNFVKNNLTLSRFTSISTEEFKSGGRSFVWPMALKGIKENPILGWGQDNFNYIFQKYYSPKMYNVEPWFDRAHNIFLDWAVAGGLLGLLSYLALYGAYLWALWKNDNSFSYEERTIFTALLAAYFFHNLFVFDQIISYFLFMALLGYIYSRTKVEEPDKRVREDSFSNPIVLSLITLALIASVYWINIKPIQANLSLIGGLASAQRGNHAAAVENFKNAYELSYLGRSELTEQMSLAAPAILSSSLSVEEKNAFYQFVKDSLLHQGEEVNGDARTEIVIGSFLAQTGAVDEGIIHLRRAVELTPGKQLAYFELGSALINKGDNNGALAIFKKALDLAPEYLEAKKLYLLGAVYAGDTKVESSLVTSIPEKEIIFDDRILSAYYAKKRFQEVILILERRVKLDPVNAATYQEYIKQVRAL